MVKRKHEGDDSQTNGSAKKVAKSQEEVHANFGDKLFDNEVVKQYRDEYAESGP